LYDPTTGIWTITGSPPGTVNGPSAPLLLDGQVLGIGQAATPSSLYDPSTGTWSATSASYSDLDQFAALLPSGEVLLAGGFVSGKRAESDASLYDPTTGQFTSENGPCQCAAFNGALLQTGEVLVAGGVIVVAGNPYSSEESIKSAELWDPSTQAWTSTGNLNGSREGESMTVLQNGQVLVIGGWQSNKNSTQFTLLGTAELYKP
jgi:hypothetical protein